MLCSWFISHLRNFPAFQFQHCTTSFRHLQNISAYSSTTAVLNNSHKPAMDEVQKVKDKYLGMSLQEKRKEYLCGEERCVDLPNIPTWPLYFKTKRCKPLSESESKEKREVVPELNDKVSLWQGDITALEIDAIVNAANSSLLGGGGVDGAIHRAAGPDLVKECRTLNGCSAGKAKITGGYQLPAKYIIHTVGPQGEHPDVLKACYKNCFKLMQENDLKSIAFCCIATGIYGYPNESAANVALSTTRDFLEKNGNKVDRVIFTTFLPVDVAVYERLLQKYFPTA